MNEPCLVTGCFNPVKEQHYCSTHYLRWMRYGDPLENPSPRKPKTECYLARCTAEAVKFNMCAKHLSLLRRSSFSLEMN